MVDVDSRAGGPRASDAALDERGEDAPPPEVRVLTRTKLHPPATRGRTVDREALLNRLDASFDYQLILVDAPAGWGKTTLLAEWCARRNYQPCAWLSLDHSDNDSVGFWTYFIEALRSVLPGVGSAAIGTLGAPGTTVLDHVLPHLINDFADSSKHVAIVLDDYHLVTNRSIHEALTYLVEHLPATIHVVLATRSDPPLPLARTRARGQLLEIRVDDLRFTAEEAAVLLNDVLELPLAPEDVARVHERTEGWAAGLYLAALSLRNHEDPSAFVAGFAGDDRHVVDYLGAEVLDGQRPEVRQFLLATSVLERLSGPVCDAVMQRDGSAQLLEEIERSNLFLVPLDSTRRWYRYHHLLRELLQHELARSNPQDLDGLHRRASEWHARHGSISAAIHHAISGRDIARASELITDHWYNFLQRGRIETVVSWIDALGEPAVKADARLCLTKAWLGINTGRLEEIDRWIGEAERVLTSASENDRDMVEQGAASLRAIHRYMAGDMAAAVEAGRRALVLERAGHASPWHPIGCPVLGVALFWHGRSEQAQAELTDAVYDARAGSNKLSEIHALGGLAAIAEERADHVEAERLATNATELAQRNGLGDHWASSLARVVRGRSHERKGEGSAALEELERAVTLSGRGIASAEIAYAHLALARLGRNEGDIDKAVASLAIAKKTIEGCRDPGILTALLERTARGATRTAGSGSAAPAGVSDELSERELSVIRLLPSDLSQREIADALYVSLNTVKTHVRVIFRKLGVSSRADAVEEGRRRGLL